jgi:hypothetical protein
VVAKKGDVEIFRRETPSTIKRDLFVGSGALRLVSISVVERLLLEPVGKPRPENARLIHRLTQIEVGHVGRCQFLGRGPASHSLKMG